MKLMPPLSVRDSRAEELARDVLRTQEMEKVAKDVRIRLADAEADFASTLARHQKDWASTEENHRQRAEEMRKEIEVLEERKSQALIPIAVLQERADNQIKEAHELLRKNQEQEEYLESVKERLENRLDTVAEKETSLHALFASVHLKKQGAERQAEEVKAQAQKLSEEMKNFYESQKEEKQKISEKKKALLLEQINLEARENKVKRDMEALKNYDLKLKDERLVLDTIVAKIKAKDPSFKP